VEVAEDGDYFVDYGVACWVGEIGGDEEVLYRLEEFHREEEKDAAGEGGIVRFGVDPPTAEEA